MTHSHRSLSFTIAFLAFAGAIATDINKSVYAQISPNTLPGEVKFNPPGDPIPQGTTGGGIRGDSLLPTASLTEQQDLQFLPPQDSPLSNNLPPQGRGSVKFHPSEATEGQGSQEIEGELQFIPPQDSTPTSLSKENARGSVKFKPPRTSAPRATTGGGVRGNIRFTPPGNPAPVATTGGGVRGHIQFAPPGAPIPNSTTGGGVRGHTHFQAPGAPAPPSTTGGGVRGDTVFSAPGAPVPDNTTGGGVRGDLSADVIPLLPETQSGYTVAPRPTIYLYVPPTSIRQVFFSLQDENRQHHYQTVLDISGEGGIVEITLPEDAPELAVGKYYTWFFAPIEPEGFLQPDNYSVSGWIKRVEPPTPSGQESLTALGQAALYANAGIWYDTLNLLAEAKRQQPEDATLKTEWEDLLKQVGLDAIADRPINERL